VSAICSEYAGREAAPGLSSTLRWFDEACRLAYLGDAAAYRRQCASRFRELAATGNVAEAELVAKAVLLLPGAADPAVALKLADLSLANGPEPEWSRAAKMLALYRLGDYPAVLRLAEDARKGVAWRDRDIMMDLITVMAHARLGARGRAAGLLQRTEGRIKSELVSGDHGDRDWRVCQILRREAEAELKRLGAARPPATQPHPPGS
jgi:hypothetical protein